MVEQDDRHRPLSRWFAGVARALMREPALVLLEHEGDSPRPQPDRRDEDRAYPATHP